METLNTGINKRFREHDLEIRNKLMREHSDSASSVDDDFVENRGDFTSRPNVSKFLNSCGDNEDKMELEDEITDVHNCLQLSTMSNKVKSKLNNKSYVKPNKAQVFDTDGNLDNDSTFVIKGGRMKIVRRIDFLVDDLIRKTNKTLDWVGECTDLSSIPSSIGPDPSTDRRFLPGRDITESAIVSAQQNNRQMAYQSDACESRSERDDLSSMTSQFSSTRSNLGSDYASPWSRAQKPIAKEKLSGDITHDDWPIEELPIAATTSNG